MLLLSFNNSNYIYKQLWYCLCAYNLHKSTHTHTHITTAFFLSLVLGFDISPCRVVTRIGAWPTVGAQSVFTEDMVSLFPLNTQQCLFSLLLTPHCLARCWWIDLKGRKLPGIDGMWSGTGRRCRVSTGEWSMDERCRVRHVRKSRWSRKQPLLASTLLCTLLLLCRSGFEGIPN